MSAGDNYVWELFDRDVRAVPPGMRQMRNLCVCHDNMVQIPGRPLLEAVKRPEIDVSQHVEGTTYRPKDVAKYQRWVRAVVERYDGDGVDDMPGLTAPIKFWQVDNEPPRRREGYADLVRITSQAVKEADPTAKVLIGGLEIPFDDYRERIYEQEQLPILQQLRERASTSWTCTGSATWMNRGSCPRPSSESVGTSSSAVSRTRPSGSPRWEPTAAGLGTIRGIPSRFNRSDSRQPRWSSGMSSPWAKGSRSCFGPGA